LDQFQGALSAELRGVIELLKRGDSAAAAPRLTALQATAPLGLHLDTPWQVVISGAPNVGKSTLINALVGYGRAIVAAEPGTTRDVVSAATAIDGWPIELSDTAGIRASVDALEVAGITLAQQKLAAADLRVLVFDRSAPFGPAEQALAAAWPDAMIVHSKSDLPPHGDARPAGIEACAPGGLGMEQLLAIIAARLVPAAPPAGSAVPFRPRHVAAIQRARSHLLRDAWQEAATVLDGLLTVQGDSSAFGPHMPGQSPHGESLC
jgi:tRNA modification GTPase